jgi:large subunit ribosomal protein L18
MNRKILREKRRRRSRSRIYGTTECPRLCVFRSLLGIYAQMIDDTKGKTLASVRTKELKDKNNIEGANKLGKLMAKKCKDKKIEKAVFDRGGYKYHGKIKAFAEGAREGGLKF